MSQHYSDPSRESDPHALPDIEVFYADPAQDSHPIYECGGCSCYHAYGWTGDCRDDSQRYDGPDDYADRNGCSERDVTVTFEAAGWYWQSCFPGCLPDSAPMGPFKTKAEALADAQENADDDDASDDEDDEDDEDTEEE